MLLLYYSGVIGILLPLVICGVATGGIRANVETSRLKSLVRRPVNPRKELVST